MDAGKENDSRLHFATDGVDFDYDDSIREFAERVWRSAADRWMGEHVSKDKIGPSTALTHRYPEAVAYASAIHGTAVRKGTDVTYMCHLLGVSSLVLEAGGTEDEAIAGLLHDAVEDAGGLARQADIEVRFGRRVSEIVHACSDSTDEQWKKSVDYWVRKQKYLDKMKTSSDAGALLVSIADKVHNARAIVTDLVRGRSAPGDGDPLGKFNGTPNQILTYYNELLDIARSKDVPDTLTIPLEIAVDEISAHVAAKTGGSV